MNYKMIDNKTEQESEKHDNLDLILKIKKLEKEIKKIKIKKDVVDPEDVEMLQDLILTCANEALRKVDSAQAESLGKYNIPGMM